MLWTHNWVSITWKHSGFSISETLCDTLSPDGKMHLELQRTFPEHGTHSIPPASLCDTNRVSRWLFMHLKHHPPSTFLLNPKLTLILFPFIKGSYHLCGASLCLYPLLLTHNFHVKLQPTAPVLQPPDFWGLSQPIAPGWFLVSCCLLGFNYHLAKQVSSSLPGLTGRYSWHSNFHSSNSIITSLSEFTEFIKPTYWPHFN